MKRLYLYFFRGLITILPIALTIYLLYIILTWTESLAFTLLRPFIGSFYIPGMGLVLGVLGILLIGYLVTKQRVRSLFSVVERPFTNIPVIKSIYSSLKNFADYFSPGTQQHAQQAVVALRIPGQELEIVGLVTRQSVDGMPAGFLQGPRVAVYLPMGYMIGGYTVFVPVSWVHPVEMSVEEAMRSSLIAWMTGHEPARVPSASAPPSEDTDAEQAADAQADSAAISDDPDSSAAPAARPSRQPH